MIRFCIIKERMTMIVKGVLLLNLGSPNSTSVADVRAYLKEFLSDPRVLDYSAFVRWLVLNIFILPRRPHKSAEAYSEIWTAEGSPLITESKRLRENLASKLDIPVALGMRYGKPSTADGIQELLDAGVNDIYIMPMYPHYAKSSYETAVVWAQEEIQRMAPRTKFSILQPFYKDEGYIEALVETAKPYLAKDFDHLLFSFHGIPQRHLIRSDASRGHCQVVPNCCEVCSAVQSTCYKHQCFQTVKHFAEKAGLPKEKYSVSFQSRLGRELWIPPYTDKTLEELPSRGVKKLLVMCPSFVSDCLETLEEIQMSGKESFIHAGGESFEQIPCLNNHPAWISYLIDQVYNWQAEAVGV